LVGKKGKEKKKRASAIRKTLREGSARGEKKSSSARRPCSRKETRKGKEERRGSGDRERSQKCDKRRASPKNVKRENR